MIVGGNPGAQKKQASMVCRQPGKIVGSSSPFWSVWNRMASREVAKARRK